MTSVCGAWPIRILFCCVLGWLGCSSSEPRLEDGTAMRLDAGAHDAEVADAAVDAGRGAGEPLHWERASDCPLARFEAGGLLFKGELWVMGGFVTESLAVTKRIDIYDPERDQWRQGPFLRGAETHIGIVVNGDELLAFGGMDHSMGDAPTDSVWRLPAGASEWAPEPPLPMRAGAFAWALLGRRLHVAGGLQPDNDSDQPAHWVRDLDGEPSWQLAPDLPDPRNHGGGVESGGKFYAVAGRHHWDENAGHTTTLNAFDPETDAWRTLAPMPLARSEISAATVTTSDGRIITVGGSTARMQPSSDVLEYDPALDRWRELTALPEPRKGAVAVRVGTRLIVTTGSPTSTDPATTTWVGCCVE